jgi:hypothetical protein
VQRFERLDRDGDGKLTPVETGNAAWFPRLDRDGNGHLTRAELQRLVDWAERSQGGGPLSAGDGSSGVPAVPSGAVTPPPLESPREGPRVLKPGDAGVGRRVADLPFVAVDGREGRLAGFTGAKALVIAFTGTGCPLARKYTPALARLECFRRPARARLFAGGAAAPVSGRRPGFGLGGRCARDRGNRGAGMRP